MPTYALLAFQRMNEISLQFNPINTVDINDIPLLMNLFPIPIMKMTPKERIQYLESMKEKKLF